jgi:two-component system chemotaxis sensor kinase CheA
VTDDRGAGREPEHVAEFMDDFYAECDDHLTSVRRLLLALEQQPAGSQVPGPSLEELFRAFHSIKGVSGMVELRDAERLSHHMEGLLKDLRVPGAALTSNGLEALIQGTHVLEQVIAARRTGSPAPAIDAVVAQIERARHGGGPAAPSASLDSYASDAAASVVRFTPAPLLSERGITVDWVRARLLESGEILSATPRITDNGGVVFDFVVTGDAQSIRTALQDVATVEAVAPPPAPPAAIQGPAPVMDDAPGIQVSPSHFVRVDLARLDALMRMIGDLVITRSRLEETTARIEPLLPARHWRDLQEDVQALGRELRDLREGVVRVRLVPIGEIFQRMPFVVRDLARESGRKVKVEVRGQDTEIDKFLIERLMDPILHLVRNAVSHGLESPAERIAAGKPPEGNISLAAATVGDVAVIEVADDGRGVDPEAVAARARAAGLHVPHGGLDGASLLDVLCTPGFSTRDVADRASGRGVGMDVVRRTVEELGGTLSIDTARGEGTRFLIELPLTLAIADALIGRVGDDLFAVPQSMVREVVEVDAADINVLENNELVPYRGGALPIFRLARLFGMREGTGRRMHVFVVGQGSAAAGIAVDKIVGQREIVVRAVKDPFIKVDAVAGATDLGNGRVVLILDAMRLAARARASATVRELPQ